LACDVTESSSTRPEGSKSDAKRPQGDRTRSKDRKQQPEDPGGDLERRVARVEFAEGAFVRIRVPVRVDAESGRDVLTDVDVLALDVDLRLSVTTGLLESKSGKGQAGEPDRLLWLSGLRAYLGAKRAVLVRQTVTRRGQAVASRLGLQVLDVPTLEVREAAHQWLPESFAHVGGAACEAAEARMSTQLKGLGHIPPDLVAFLKGDVFLSEPHRALGAVVALGRATSQGPLPEPAGTVLASHSLVALIVAALQNAGELDALPQAQMKHRLELALTIGSPDDTHVLEVLDRADAVTQHVVEQVHRKYTDAGAARQEVAAPSLRDIVAQPPPWLERYMDFVTALRENPYVARELLQTAELACFDAMLGDSGWKASAFDHLFTPEHRHLLQVATRLLESIAGKGLAGALAPLERLDFDRSGQGVPERRGTSTMPTKPTAPEEVVAIQKTLDAPDQP
jgi:hypothetical protein